MIFDCFTFFNELELLELRLHELAGVVDKFVLVSDLDEIPRASTVEKKRRKIPFNQSFFRPPFIHF